MASTSTKGGDSTGDRSRQFTCFNEWTDHQGRHLTELVDALVQNSDEPNRDALLTDLIGRNIKHFEDYTHQRDQLAREDISPFFAPTWCTSLECSLLWMAGCRPSLFVRLVYALCGSQIESQLMEYLQGARTGDLSELTAKQLVMVDGLQNKIIREEDKLSARLTSLQEDIADKPIALIAREMNKINDVSEEAEDALGDHDKLMVNVMLEADQLRVDTLKELLVILTPQQGVEFLAASKKLHLCMHEWGTKRDHNHGRS